MPITALEEPEAPLHPSAVPALMPVVRDLPGQDSCPAIAETLWQAWIRYR